MSPALLDEEMFDERWFSGLLERTGSESVRMERGCGVLRASRADEISDVAIVSLRLLSELTVCAGVLGQVCCRALFTAVLMSGLYSGKFPRTVRNLPRYRMYVIHTCLHKANNTFHAELNHKSSRTICASLLLFQEINMPPGEALTDDYIASLLARDAKAVSAGLTSRR